MVKKGRGNADYFKATNQAKKEKTITLIRDAVSLMNETNDMLDIKAVSQKTKEIDLDGKGVSEATFRKKDLEHIQSLMLELGIGKYGKIKISQNSAEINLTEQVLKFQRENKKMKKTLSEYNKKLKNMKLKLDQVLLENEELRLKIYEMEMNEKIKNKIPSINNIKI
jgi:hypothetical protein